MKGPRDQRGVTFIELIAATVIVAVASLGLMLAVGGAVGRSADPMIETQATAIARAYLEEVSLAGFCDPEYDPDGDPATGCRQECVASPCASGCGGAAFAAETDRAHYDDVCDYDGLADTGARDRRGVALAELAAYTVRVGVRDSGVTLGAPALASDAGRAVRIEISVEHAGLAAPIRMSAWRANID
ncbi:MAG TPA: type II secretion system protein [Gammaproteobacteria bacterium]|nr:type II secretion system protein [Gammaproteobacteria bacterium]